MKYLEEIPVEPLEIAMNRVPKNGRSSVGIFLRILKKSTMYSCYKLRENIYKNYPEKLVIKPLNEFLKKFSENFSSNFSRIFPSVHGEISKESPKKFRKSFWISFRFYENHSNIFVRNDLRNFLKKFLK